MLRVARVPRPRAARPRHHGQGGSSAPSIHTNVTQEQSDAIDAVIRNGRIIEAIKLYRTATGTSLKEAKDRVQARALQLRQSPGFDAEMQGVQSGAAPSPFEAKRGCLGALVLLFLAARH